MLSFLLRCLEQRSNPVPLVIFLFPGGEDVPGMETSEQELSLADLTLGVGSDRSLGRPNEWNGESNGFDDFALMFAKWLSGLPGDAERPRKSLRTWDVRSCWPPWNHETRSWQEVQQLLCVLLWARQGSELHPKPPREAKWIRDVANPVQEVQT